MATYIPNATQTTEPVESRTVESAALEFRTLKASINGRIEDVQEQNNNQDVRIQAIEAALLVIGEGGLPGTVYVQRLSGTGAQTAFTLGVSVPTSALIDIFIDGIYQNKDTFTVVDNVLTFSEAPPAGTDNIEVVVSITIANVETDASLVSFRATDSTTVVRTAQDKMREWVSVLDFGADPTGSTECSDAFNTALAQHNHVIVPPGQYLISQTVVVPALRRLDFQGGGGNAAVTSGAYLIKSAAMAGYAITIGQGAAVTGGGVLGQIGNTGGGVWLLANAAKLSDFWVKSIGGFGVKVGADTFAYRNVNSTIVDRVFVSYCTDHGIIVDDGYSTVAPDANAGTVSNCVSVHNAGSGIFIGYAYWVSVINCNCEVNDGYGLYLSGADKSSYPACRWATVVGGDYNEGNVAGIVYDASYFSTFVNPDPNNLPATPSNGLQGSALRTYIGGSTTNTFPSINTTEYESVLTTPDTSIPVVSLRTRGTGSVSDGPTQRFMLSQDGGSSYRVAAAIKSYQLAANYDAIDFSVNDNGVLSSIFAASAYYYGLIPSADGAYNLGHPSFRWGTVYASTGAINTSDSRAKLDISSLDESEKRVALALKGLIRKFRFKDSVEKKGAAARIHVGVIAQDVIAAFEAEGLDPIRYGIVCHDQWDEIGEAPAGDRYGIRYDELLAFVVAAI